MAQGDDVAGKVRELIKEHFRLRRDPYTVVSAEERKQVTNGFLDGVGQTLEVVGGCPEEVQFTAYLRLLVNRGRIDEADAEVDAL